MSENEFRSDIERWIALRTSARWDKKIATMLQNCQVPAFVPTMTRTIQYASKRQSSEIPLFSGYVFTSEADFIGNSQVPINCRNQIAQILRPSDPQQLHRELQAIAELTKHHRLVQEKIFGQPGERVVIRGGSFTGQEGTILKLNPNKKTITIEVSFIHCQLVIEIEEHLVEKAP